MKIAWMLAASLASLALIAADPTLARTKRKPVAVARCEPAPARPWFSLWSRPEPQANGCAPAVHVNGKFIGQDPDPNIRHQLLREPGTGYSAVNN